jgi:hypothetical protein
MNELDTNKTVYEVLDYLKDQTVNSIYKNHIFLWGGFLRDKVLNITPLDIDIIIVIPKSLIGNHMISLQELFNEDCFINTSPSTVQVEKFGIKFDIRLLENTNDESPVEIVKRSILYNTDFNINTMCMDICKTAILDFTHQAMNDLNNKILNINRHIGLDIFSQYPIRIYRLIRISCTLDMKIPLSLLRYIKNNAYIMNFTERKQVDSEFQKILASTNAERGIRLLKFFGIDVGDVKNNLITLNKGWYEIEPGVVPHRVILENNQRWSESKAQICIHPEVFALRFEMIKSEHNDKNIFEYFYDNNEGDIKFVNITQGHNIVIIDTIGKKSITILTPIFIPAKLGKSTDVRELGHCFKRFWVFTNRGMQEIPIKDISYIL